MLKTENRIFTNIPATQSPDLRAAMARGDWHQTAQLFNRTKIIEEVTKSGLRGRGGAGFMTSMKWGFMPSSKITRYLVVNADEGEPGTCKDREILRCEPHKLLEGIALACYALGVHHCYIYVRGEFYQEAQILQQAITEAKQAGLLGNNYCGSGQRLRVDIHMGAGAYICGEETAMLESLEGKKGQPRLKPPYPPQVGLYGLPATVQNVETLAVIPTILKRGGEWFASLGNKGGRGTKLFCISGNVHNPCTIEEEMGITLRELIDTYAGGVIGGWDNLQAVIPGGSSTPILPKHLCQNLSLDFDSLKAVGSYLGTGAVIVLNNSVDIIAAVHNLAAFYKHESCGQCTPCREGCGWMMRAVEDIQKGNATQSHLQTLGEVANQIEGHTICAFGEAAATPIKSLLKHFGEDIQNALRHGPRGEGQTPSQQGGNGFSGQNAPPVVNPSGATSQKSAEKQEAKLGAKLEAKLGAEQEAELGTKLGTKPSNPLEEAL